MMLLFAGCCIRFYPLIVWITVFCLPMAGVRAETYKVGIVSSGTAPYFYMADDKPVGIVIDLLNQMNSPGEFEFEYANVPRKRLDELFQEGYLDIRIANPMWISKGIPFISTKPVLVFEDIFFVLASNSDPINEKTDLTGKRICTNLGYRYSRTLESMIKEGIILRDDSKTEKSKIEKLLRNRCDALLGEKNVVYHWAKKLQSSGRIRATNLVDSRWPVHFVLQPDAHELKNYLDEQLSSPVLSEFVKEWSGSKDYP